MTEPRNGQNDRQPSGPDRDLFDKMMDSQRDESGPVVPRFGKHTEDVDDMMTDRKEEKAQAPESKPVHPTEKAADMMTDKKQESDHRPQSRIAKFVDLILAIGIVIAIIVFILKAPGVAGTVALVVLGFGAVVFIHELGHFVVAKLGRIKVEAFSIGFPPTVLAVRKLKKGFRVRLFPKGGQEPALEEGDSETDYWLGAIPFGGFVKMLGQSDSGTAEKTDDPRSFLDRLSQFPHAVSGTVPWSPR